MCYGGLWCENGSFSSAPAERDFSFQSPGRADLWKWKWNRAVSCTLKSSGNSVCVWRQGQPCFHLNSSLQTCCHSLKLYLHSFIAQNIHGNAERCVLLPYLEKRCVIIFIVGVFLSGTGELMAWTRVLLICSTASYLPSCLALWDMFEKNIPWIKPHLSFKGFLDTGWQRVIHAHLTEINQKW